MGTEGASSEIIERQRAKLLNFLQQDPDSVLDTLTSRRLISEEEYETLEEITDPLKKSRKLLILVQKKGEVSCCCFLRCLATAFPESAASLGLKLGIWKEHTVTAQSSEVSRDSEDPISLTKKTPEDAEIAPDSKEEERVGRETLEFFTYEESNSRETAVSSRENEEGCGTPQVTAPHSVEYEVPASITYLIDGQRYEEPDDSLYLEEGDYQEPVGYPEDAETAVEEGACHDLQCFVYDGEEDSEYEETMGFSNEESSCEASETPILLEEEEGSTEERKRVFQRVLSSLNMDRSRKLLPDFVRQFSIDRRCEWTPETPGDLAWNFLVKVQALDSTARDFILRPRKMAGKESKEELLAGMENLATGDIQTINPLDVLCACMLCSDSTLQHEVMSNMARCQFALPLLLPDAENNKSILMMGAMKDLKQHPRQASEGAPREAEMCLNLRKMPVISFVRLGHCSFSKSRILNTLLNSSQQKPCRIFLHRDLSTPVLPRQISDGLVEVTWYFPDSTEAKESPPVFQKPVAVANLRGDLESFWTQFGFLVEISSAVFFFTDYLSEKEWNLLMFLGEDAIGRCYFILSPQAKESEEAQVFQRVLKLKPSQLLFWEAEEAGDTRKTMEDLQAALQEVMSSSLKYLSLEDMASLARELGIQVDQDFEITQVVQVSPSTVEGENQQPCRQTKSTSESQSQKPTREPGAQRVASRSAQNFHQTPALMPHPVHPWPLPIKAGSNFYHVSLKAPWVMSSHFGPQQRAKGFFPLFHQNTMGHRRGKYFGIQNFQPLRFYSGEGFMKFPGTSQGYHLSGASGRSERQTFHVRSHPESTQTARTLQRSGIVVSHVGHSPGTKAAGKSQPGKACAQGTQLTEATGKPMRTPSHIKYPHPQTCHPAGAIQERIMSGSYQGSQWVTQGRPSDLAFQPGSQATSGSKHPSPSQFNSHQPKFQSKHVQPKPSQPVPSQKKTPHSQASQAKPSQAKPSPSKSTQFNPHRPQQSQSKPSQPRSTQLRPSQTRPSQAKAYHARAGKR
ncbi:caspase recruitment domain-containing protein 6 [Acomys russatus]|uniref:caspase recruitment domain-containing protein 6 n=1 Tax=Acomys russatus TaxID=60746 RepID=UPI0021E21009|nr:caspase recruitment domain-containing protein 6 [Acomys russatus]